MSQNLRERKEISKVTFFFKKLHYIHVKAIIFKECSTWELQLEAILVVFIVQDKTSIENGKMQQKKSICPIWSYRNSFSIPPVCSPLVYYRTKARWLWPGYPEEERSSGSEAGHALSRACHAQMWEERGSKTILNPIWCFCAHNTKRTLIFDVTSKQNCLFTYFFQLMEKLVALWKGMKNFTSGIFCLFMPVFSTGWSCHLSL